MSIFRCDKCGCIENTATSNYWTRRYPMDGGEEEPLLCSECDPEIGKWHGCFPKESADGMNIGKDGFLYHPDYVPQHTIIVGTVPGELRVTEEDE